MTINPVASKYQLVSNPPLPSVCIGCNNPAKGELFIDTTASIDYYGAIVLCVSCIKEMSSLVGYIPADRCTDLENANSELTLALHEAKEKVRSLEDVVRTYGLEQFTIADNLPSVDDFVKDEESEIQSSDSSEGFGDSVSETAEPRLFE